MRQAQSSKGRIGGGRPGRGPVVLVAGGVDTARGTGKIADPPRQYNPGGREDNCGFCAISRGLERTTNQAIDADKLYLQLLQKLRLPTGTPDDPISRMLLFHLNRDGREEVIAPPTHRNSMEEYRISPDQYTVRSVAETLGLRNTGGNLKILNMYITILNRGIGYEKARKALAEEQADQVESRGGNPPALDVMERWCLKELSGEAIVGSKGAGFRQAGHFINMFIQDGIVEFYDPQSGARGNAQDMWKLLGRQIDLFLRLQS